MLPAFLLWSIENDLNDLKYNKDTLQLILFLIFPVQKKFSQIVLSLIMFDSNIKC